MAPSVSSPGGSTDDDLLFGDGIGVDVSKMNLPDEYILLVQKAVTDPVTLTPRQLEDISRTLCAKAFEKSIYSYPISSILVTICDKNSDRPFIESLIGCCREWFADRNRSLRLPEGSSNAIPRKYRWPAYVSFVTDFYLNLKCKLRGVKLMEEEDGETNDEDEDAVMPSDHVHLEFADLLFDCCSDIVSILDTTRAPTSEIECLLNVLRSVGKHMEKDNPRRMQRLIDGLKSVFVGPVSGRLPENCVKSILELIEWSASGWHFNKHQVAYYYPSMS